MSPSELDTKAPSVPPHPFKVGDKLLRLIDHTGRFQVERVVVTSLPIDHTGRFQVERSGEWRGWCSSNELFFDTSASIVTPGNKLEDTVNHPNHYTAGTLETIDAIEAMVGQAGWSPATGYRLGNVLKYLWRHAHKGGLESLKKARWYLDREIAAAEKAVEKAQEKKP
jgi:hypothetical protein